MSLPNLDLDSWFWKIAAVLALVGAREFVRLLSPRQVAGETGENSKWLIETLDSAAIAIGLVLFIIQPFLLQAFYIPSGSMEDTLQGPPPGQQSGGDRLLVSKLIYRLRDPQFQDVVVFQSPPEADSIAESGRPDDFIKRCIGTPGDVVEVRNRQLYRNGERVAEPYVKWSPQGAIRSYDMKIVNGMVYSREYMPRNTLSRWLVNGVPANDDLQAVITRAPPGKVPPGRLLMLGDHRNNSNDSHVWGFVPRENVVGKAICVFWPPRRLGLVDRMSRLTQPTATHNRTAVTSAP